MTGRHRGAALRRPAHALEAGERPAAGPESSVDKLYYSEMDKRHQELIQEILGPYGQLSKGCRPSWPWTPTAARARGQLGLQLPLVAGRHDLLRLVRDPEEHHRRARARLPREVRADRLARREALSPWTSTSPANRSMLRDLAREFLAESARRRRSASSSTDATGYDEALWKQLAETGLLGITIDEQHGGQGLGMVELALVLEEMGRAAYPGPFFATVVLAATAIAAGGDRAQMAPTCRTSPAARPEGDARAAGGRPRRWRPAAIGLRARSQGDEYVLTGRKRFVPFAHVADLILVAARTATPPTRRAASPSSRSTARRRA